MLAIALKYSTSHNFSATVSYCAILPTICTPVLSTQETSACDHRCPRCVERGWACLFICFLADRTPCVVNLSVCDALHCVQQAKRNILQQVSEQVNRRYPPWETRDSMTLTYAQSLSPETPHPQNLNGLVFTLQDLSLTGVTFLP